MKERRRRDKISNGLGHLRQATSILFPSPSPSSLSAAFPYFPSLFPHPVPRCSTSNGLSQLSLVLPAVRIVTHIVTFESTQKSPSNGLGQLSRAFPAVRLLAHIPWFHRPSSLAPPSPPSFPAFPSPRAFSPHLFPTSATPAPFTSSDGLRQLRQALPAMLLGPRQDMASMIEAAIHHIGNLEEIEADEDGDGGERGSQKETVSGCEMPRSGLRDVKAEEMEGEMEEDTEGSSENEEDADNNDGHDSRINIQVKE
ncbi:unnamed protein product [Closterium sp. NIES-64]|nr:unnamed protein product [Closterium sp. NIES-64]